MPLRSNQSVSFAELKQHQRQSDPCVLRSVRPLTDTSAKLTKRSNIPRSYSDPTRHKVAYRSLHLDESGSSRARLGPPPFYASTQNRRHSVKLSYKESNAKVATIEYTKPFITPTTISSPQPLDLHGLPNGLDDIESPQVNLVPVQRRTKGDSPTKLEEVKKNRRRGVVLTEAVSDQSSEFALVISAPLETEQGNTEIKPRTIAQQRILLRELAKASNVPFELPDSESEKNRYWAKPKPRSVEVLNDLPPRPRASSGGKMADKIQRTIRALYDGNSSRRASMERLDGEMSDDENMKLKPMQLGSKSESSPKPEKRPTRKSRSPKPVRRVTVPVKDIDGSRRFKWRGSVNRIVRKFGQGQTLMQGGTFDVHLEDCPPSLNNEFVPFVVDLCCRVVEERGLTFMGIYRVPGNSGTLSALQEELNFRGLEAVDLENDPRFCELNVVSSLLKSFFRKLPDPLFTNELYEDFISMNRKKDSEERLNGLRRLIHMLPAPHYETLKFLVSHLKKVADNSDVNKMEIRNLAIVFGPTLVRSTISDNMATMVTDMSDQCRIVESVLQHSAWFFSDADMKESGLQLQPPPSEDPHEPVPNIDHLLANVGRTPGDTSDSTSESSKSKASVASEKESFSRDVMEMIFGAGKRWLQNQQGGVKLEEQDSSDDEYGFKEAQRNHVRAAQPKQTPPTPPKSPAHTSAPAKYQVAKPAASGIRAGWPAKGQSHLPHDIPARLYDFYVENLERLAKTDVARPFPNFSSSSTDTSPQVTPRSSQFGPPTPQRSHPMQPRRSSGAGLKNPEPRDVVTRHSTDTQPTVPSLYGESLQNKRYCKNPSDFTAVLATSTPLRPGDRQPQKVTSSAMTQNNTELSSINKDEEQNESDSDTSVYVGDTLEEKLKNLTNLDKKLERRPSRRYANRNYDVTARIPPLPLNYPTSKKLTAPSLKAGEVVTPDNIHMFPPTKKSSREMYQERKAQRQQHRDFVKANRVTRKESMLARCASDENIFNRCDPKRQVIRPNPGDDVTINQSRRRGSRDKVKRRHTLGASDFPGQDFWDKSVYNSLQNIAPESAMARLRPKLGSADPVVPKLPQARTVLAGNNPRFEKSRKTESYL